MGKEFFYDASVTLGTRSVHFCKRHVEVIAIGTVNRFFF